MDESVKRACAVCGATLPPHRTTSCEPGTCFVKDEGAAVKWHLRFLKLADHVAGWSKDPSTKVGAVIIDKDRRVVGMGYNGFPRGVLDSSERYENRPVKYKMIVHSEANAILNARTSVRDCTMYSTKFPCSECAKLIIQSEISEIYAPAPKADEVWTEDSHFSRQMFKEADVDFHEIVLV